jgi:ABC-type branched-subunit amino acid transport system substrate-binding protein
MAIASGTVDGAGACNPTEVERQARKLIQSKRVASVFGGLTWATPKAAKPVLEELDVLPSCGR